MPNKSCLYSRHHTTKHGKCDTRLYRIWQGMKKRCCNERDPTYHNYQENLTIDRIDVNKGYEPNNCRWADRYTQNVNTRHELYGWSFEDSFLTPKCKDRSYKRYSNYEQH